MIQQIVIDDVDMRLLNQQRIQLHELLLADFDGTERGDLWGLLAMLDHIVDVYGGDE